MYGDKNACCAFGHRFVYENVGAKLEKVLIELVENRNMITFYTGGMGDFDSMYSSAVRKIKLKYSDVRLVLVKPYFTNDLNTDKDFYIMNYDSVIIPEELMGVHYKAAVKQRNRWMIDNSNYVITYVNKDFGGAYEAQRYAKSKDKKLINIEKRQP